MSTGMRNAAKPAGKFPRHKLSKKFTDRFEVGPVLAKRPINTCYEVLDRETHRRLVCKVCKSKYLACYKNETHFLSSVRHVNVVGLVHSFMDDNQSCLVLELCGHGDMYAFVKSRPLMSEFMTGCLIFQALQALKYLQKVGIVHRDIKPENYFVTSDFIVKLGDFEFAILEKDSTIPMACGTPLYMSPEIASRESFGLKSDLWSFGCLIYFMLTRNPLLIANYAGRSSYLIPGFVGTNGSDLIQKLVKLKPDDRATVDQVESHAYFEDLIKSELRNDLEIMKHHMQMDDDSTPVCVPECKQRKALGKLKITKVKKLEIPTDKDAMKSNKSRHFFKKDEKVNKEGDDAYAGKKKKEKDEIVYFDSIVPRYAPRSRFLHNVWRCLCVI